MNVICAAIDTQKTQFNATIKYTFNHWQPEPRNLTELLPVENILAWKVLSIVYCGNLKPEKNNNTLHKTLTTCLQCEHQTSSYCEKSSCFVSGMITTRALTAELNFILSSLTYSENASAQSYNNTSTNIQIFNNFKLTGKKQNKKHRATPPPLVCRDQQVSSPPKFSSELCPGRPQPNRSCNTYFWWVKHQECLCFWSVCYYPYSPVVQKCLRILEDVSCATTHSKRSFIHRYFKPCMEQVPHHTVRYKWPFQLQHINNTFMFSFLQVNKWMIVNVLDLKMIKNTKKLNFLISFMFFYVCTFLLSRCEAAQQSIISESSCTDQ